MKSILPDKGTPIKIERHPDRESPSTRGGVIVLRMGLNGIQTMEIIADESDEDAHLRERLTAARPVLDMLQAVLRER